MSYSAQAQEDDGGPIWAYQQYNTALEAKDTEAAYKYSKLAYERALAEWGESKKETGYLAANYGDLLILRENVSAAILVFEKCESILEPFLAEAAFDLITCQFKLASLYRGKKNTKKATEVYKRLVVVAEPFTEQDIEIAAMAGQAYVQLASFSLPKKVISRKSAQSGAQKYVKSRDYAEKAIPLLIMAYGEENQLVGTAQLISGYYYEVNEEWAEARDRYKPAYENIKASLGEDDDTTYSALGRLKYASVRAYRTDEARSFKGRNVPDGCEVLEQDGKDITVCSTSRRAPKFPNSANYKGQSGFVLAKFDIDETGKVVNIRIDQSWPGDAFDKAVLTVMRSWRYKPPVDQDGNVVYAKGVTTFVSFELIE